MFPRKVIRRTLFLSAGLAQAQTVLTLTVDEANSSTPGFNSSLGAIQASSSLA